MLSWRMRSDLRKNTVEFTFRVFACLTIPALLWAQEAKTDNPKQSFTGYPPAVQVHFFLACPSDKPLLAQRIFVSIRCPTVAAC